jgi:LemA protein
MTLPELIVLGVAAALLVGFVLIYNSLVAIKKLTDNAWADVDVYLKRRAELVPNLVQAVKGASAYEAGTLERIVQARSSALSSDGPTLQKADAESQLSGGLAHIFALKESYPELQANSNFLNLQTQLSDTEKSIASARQYYNACVRDYNTKIESFPQSLIAGAAGMKAKDFFEIEDASQREAPVVQTS